MLISNIKIKESLPDQQGGKGMKMLIQDSFSFFYVIVLLSH